MKHIRCILLLLLAFVHIAGRTSVWAQVTIESLQPIGCRLGDSTRVTIQGKNLDETLRAITSLTSCEVVVESTSETKAFLDIAVPPDAPLGPIGLWIASSASAPISRSLLVDDLPIINDNGQNHTSESAQSISCLTAVSGVCDGSKSDFYSFEVKAQQQVSFEVLTQQLESEMDPVAKLTLGGTTLVVVDDDGVGPECRFSYEFAEAGTVLLEIRDSRYKSAGSPYYLRVGDFPIAYEPIPAVARPGEKTSIQFVGGGDAVRLPKAATVSVPVNHLQDTFPVSAKFPNGDSASWCAVRVAMAPPYVESHNLSSKAEPVALPAALSGRLSEPGEQDEYLISGMKGQKVRFESYTRSLGSQALMEMELLDESGKRVAQTSVADEDEWSFDYTFPKDGNYTLRTSDLLKRGGDGFSYVVEVLPQAGFSVNLNPDQTKRNLAVEQTNGAFALKFQVARSGYDGAIRLEMVRFAIARRFQKLRIVNPIIPAGAKDATIYVAAQEDWSPENFDTLEFYAHPVDDPTSRVAVSTLASQRAERPYVPFPAGWSQNVFCVRGLQPRKAFFELENASDAMFARPVNKHSVTLSVKRTDEKFKGGLTFLGDTLPDGWTLAAKNDKDNYSLNFTRDNQTASDIDEQAQIELLVYSEHDGRGRLDATSLPIQWFDPVQVSVQPIGSLVAGGEQNFRAVAVRTGKGSDQAIALNFDAWPEGLAGPPTITIAAGENQADFAVRAVAGLSDTQLQSSFEFVSKLGEQDIKANGQFAVSVLAAPAHLQVFPQEVSLVGTSDRRQVVLTGVDQHDALRDWTHDAVVSVANPAIARVEKGVVFPVKDGETDLIFSVGPRQVQVPVTVRDAEQPNRIGFESDVLVALSKQGCNSGACHGSPSGKAMFRLSLRAFDRKLDELTLVREDFGRRVNKLEPEKSLLLLKPLMKVNHGGGKQLHLEDAAYSLLHGWIAQGANLDPPETARCERIEVFPGAKRTLSLDGGGQQLSVLAHFSDGTARDVTHLAAYESSDSTVATVDALGMIAPVGRGESAILVRYLEHIVSQPVMFVEHDPDFRWKSPQEKNYIDHLVFAKLRQLQYLPSQLCNDSEFIRRVYLDVIGVLPSVAETRAFLADSQTDKRARLIEQLLVRDEYAKYWALKWGDLLKMTGKLVGDEGVYKYHQWVERAFAENMPYDEFAQQLIAASGSTLSNPPANFYRTASDMNECVENVSQLFLGARLQCAKCHNHPFERWTQDNYYGLAAFFDRVKRRKTNRPGETFIWTAASGEVKQPRTGQTMKPWLPSVGEIDVADGQDRRLALVQWLVDPQNPYFARIEANRIWSHLFGRGIVDPIDDFRDSNPPSNAALLDALSNDFIESGYDRKHLLRAILNSHTYQASYETDSSNAEDTLYFSHQLPRLLKAEQLLDAVNDVLGLTQQYGHFPEGTKATHLPAPDLVDVDFLKVFGQPERNTVCACERSDDSNLGMAIELFNGATIHSKLRDENNRFRKQLAAGEDLPLVLEQLYLAALCRPPNQTELATAVEHCMGREDLGAGVEDVCWALLNTDEFLFQH